MNALAAVAGLIAIAAITPGPNNLVVLRAAARDGAVAAIPSIAAIVAGGLALLGLVATGAGAVLAAEPRLRAVITAGGCLYVAGLGLRLLAAPARRSSRAAEPVRSLPAGPMALLGFQLVNPKAWMMVLTATGSGASRWHLVALFAVIPPVCLAVWSVSGAALSGLLSRPRAAAWFDRGMGALLIACAIALGVDA